MRPSPRQLWRAALAFQLAHLKKASSGHLLKASSGHLSKGCPAGCTYSELDISFSGVDASRCTDCYGVDNSTRYDEVGLDGSYTVALDQTSQVSDGVICWYREVIDASSTVLDWRRWNEPNCENGSGSITSQGPTSLVWIEIEYWDRDSGTGVNSVDVEAREPNDPSDFVAQLFGFQGGNDPEALGATLNSSGTLCRTNVAANGGSAVVTAP